MFLVKIISFLHSKCSFQVLYDATDKVVGIATKDMGISKDGSKKENFQPGVDIKGLCLLLSLSSSIGFSCTKIRAFKHTGRVTLFAEGCRGSLSEVRRSVLIIRCTHDLPASPADANEFLTSICAENNQKV